MTSEIDYQGVSNTLGDLDASLILQRVTMGLTEEGRIDFIPCHFRQVLSHFRQMGWIDNFLKNSLALIQRQYKQTPVGAKGTIWAAKDDAIWGFSAMGRSKTSKAHIPKTPCLNILLNIFSFNYWNWVYYQVLY